MTTTEEETLASLTRVSHKLALTTPDRLGSVIDKLLPKLLQRLGSETSQQIQQKLIEMLSHIMKRVKEDTSVPLPCEAMLQLFFLPPKDDTANKYQRNFEMHPMTLHFALAFLAVGVPRCTTNPFPLLPYLVAGQSFSIATPAKKSQSHQMAHLLLQCLSLCTANIATEEKEKYVQVTRELLQHNETLQATLFDLFLDVLLYPSSYDSQTTLPPPGLSQSGHERLRSVEQGGWQTAVIEWIAPQRYALFPQSESGRGRTICLLVVSSSIYLKQYMESNSENLLGDPVRLSWTLLSLCLGQAQAEPTSLYLGRSQPDDPTPTPQLLLSIQRRPLTDPSTLLSFVTQSVFQNHPRIDLQPVVPLALQVIETILHTSVPSRGLSVLRAKSYIASAELLQILAIRLAEDWDSEQLWQRRILVVACRILSPASSSLHAGTTTRTSDSEGNLAIRDACYGTISTLCRSSFALSGYIFGDGTSSVQTATMLFGCVAHEEEKLKPRAVAALDALLGSYIRLYSHFEESKPIVEASSNPWASTSTSETKSSTAAANNGSADRSKLLAALLPLVWTAAQSYQPKASRVAAARWASELLQSLDRASACHVLCFLAGDNDPTAANLAREGLGLSATLEESEYDMAVEEKEASSARKLPDFGRFVSFVFQDPSKQQRDFLFRSQYFDDFSLKGKAATLHFGMLCLLNDFYGGSDEPIRSYLEALTRSLILYKSGSMRIDSAHSLDAVDLLDVCSSSLAALLSASKFARECFMNGSLFGFKELQELAVHVNSSRARRYLAKSCGIMLEDNETMEKEDSQSPVLLPESAFDLCLTILSDIEGSRTGSLSRTHGSVFLGAYAIKALRKRISQNASLASSSLLQKAATVLAKLGYGCMHSEELVGNACSDGLVIAFHSDDNSSVHLGTEFCQSSVIDLRKLAEANAKFSHTDSLNVLRALKCAAASGACLAATTYPQQDVDKDVLLVLHATRQTCVESLIGLLGSAAFRNEEEIAIGVGEALAMYASAYNTDEIDTFNHSIKKWPDTYDEELRLELSPAEDILYVLLRKTLLSSSPQTRTSVAPALLAITAMAARKVSESAAFLFETDETTNFSLVKG
jgi:proteasome component ECM29